MDILLMLLWNSHKKRGKEIMKTDIQILALEQVVIMYLSIQCTVQYLRQ